MGANRNQAVEASVFDYFKIGDPSLVLNAGSDPSKDRIIRLPVVFVNQQCEIWIKI